MHEMSIAQNVIEIVERQLQASGMSRPRSVRLRIGEMAGIVPDSLDFCFMALTEDSALLKGTSLVIDRVPVAALCNACGKTSDIEVPVFFCPVCGSADLKLLSGMELEVVSIEFGDGEHAGV